MRKNSMVGEAGCEYLFAINILREGAANFSPIDPKREFQALAAPLSAMENAHG